MPPQSQQQQLTVRPEPRRQRVTPGRRVSLRFRFCVHVTHCAVFIQCGPNSDAAAQVNGRITFVTSKAPPACSVDGACGLRLCALTTQFVRQRLQLVAAGHLLGEVFEGDFVVGAVEFLATAVE